MHKIFIIFFFIIFVPVSFLRGDNLSLTPGELWLKERTAEYNEGKHKSYLEHIDKVYLNETTEASIHEAYQALKGAPEEREKMKQFLQIFHQKACELDDKLYANLKTICKEHEEEPIAQLVRSVSQGAHERPPLDDSLLSDNPSDPIEKEYQRLVLELVTKRDLAYLEKLKNAETRWGAPQIDEEKLKIEQFILQLDFMQKMTQFIKKYPDHPLASQIEASLARFPLRTIQSENMNYLFKIAYGEIPVLTPTEVKVAKIVLQYSQELETLVKTYLKS